MIHLKERFKKYSDDFLKFNDIAAQLHRRPDMCAFMLLDSVLPSPSAARKMISAAEHGIIYLDINIKKLGEIITDDQVLYLVRCGVMYDDAFECLSMFV